MNNDDNLPSASSSQPVNSPVVSEQNTKKTAHSSQMQLLALARHFALLPAQHKESQPLSLNERTQAFIERHHELQQRNLEAILLAAVEKCASDQVSDRIDLDWFDRFIHLAKTVYNKTLQQLWSDILIIEMEHPGSFSFATLNCFQQLSLQEAKLFSKACQIALSTTAKHSLCLVTGSYQLGSLFSLFKPQHQFIDLSHFGLNYTDILTLEAIGLLHKQEIELTIAKEATLTLKYQDEQISIAAGKRPKFITCYKFTQAGNELYRMVHVKKDDSFIQNVSNL